MEKISEWWVVRFKTLLGELALALAQLSVLNFVQTNEIHAFASDVEVDSRVLMPLLDALKRT